MVTACLISNTLSRPFVHVVFVLLSLDRLFYYSVINYKKKKTICYCQLDATSESCPFCIMWSQKVEWLIVECFQERRMKESGACVFSKSITSPFSQQRVSVRRPKEDVIILIWRIYWASLLNMYVGERVSTCLLGDVFEHALVYWLGAILDGERQPLIFRQD